MSFLKYTCRQFDPKSYHVKHYYLNLLLSFDSKASLLLSPTDSFNEFELSWNAVCYWNEWKKVCKMQSYLKFHLIQNSSISINIIHYYTILFLLYTLIHYMYIACLHTFHLKIKINKEIKKFNLLILKMFTKIKNNIYEYNINNVISS